MRKRIYIPSSYLKEVGLMTEEWYYPLLDNRYTSVLQKMITYIDTVEKDVQPGFTYIPNSCIFAVELATKNYLSIFYQIKQNPNIVFEKSLRSNKWMMLKDFICLRIHYLWRK